MLHVFSNVDRWGASPVEKMEGLLRRSCAHPSSVTMSFLRHLMVCLPGETCENEGRFDTLSIPNCVIKNRPTHGARHGNTEERRIHHMAYNAWKRCRKKKKRWYIGSLSEQSKAQSITSGTWVDRRVVCETRRTCAGGPIIHVNSQRTPTPRINLDSSSQQFGQNGPMSERPGYAEAVRIRNRLCKKSGEATGRIHPSQQRRQRSHNPCLETSQGSARLDRKTGWEWYSNPSPWTTSEFWWTLSSRDE